MPITFIKEVNENSSCRIKFTIKDFDDVAIPNTSINTATMDLKNKTTGVVINSRTAVDVSGDIDGSGILSRIFTAADNPIITTDLDVETHIATFTINATVGGNVIDLVENVWIKVWNLKNV